MNFTALKAELAARGFDQMTDTRLGQYVNAARQQLDNRSLWPYRLTTTQGVAPLSITDLGTIVAVTNETAHYSLSPTNYADLAAGYGDLTISGLPQFFYVDWSTGAARLVTYATNGNTIKVTYFKRTVDLAAGADAPLAPADYHMLIVDMAAQRAYMDSDNYQAATQLQGWVDGRLSEMVNSLLGGQQIAGPAEVMAVSDASVDS